MIIPPLLAAPVVLLAGNGRDEQHVKELQQPLSFPEHRDVPLSCLFRLQRIFASYKSKDPGRGSSDIHLTCPETVEAVTEGRILLAAAQAGAAESLRADVDSCCAAAQRH